MEVIKHLHMNGGIGKTSYYHNSSLQKEGISMTKPIIEEAILDVVKQMEITNSITDGDDISNHSLSIADLGCSSGPNTFLVASQFIQTVCTKLCHQCHSTDEDNNGKVGVRALPEFLVFLNDLPGNDFNTVFRSLLASFYQKLKETIKTDCTDSCHVAGVPGTFYGRLFQRKSLHFVHSSYSLHWLSQVPVGLESCNKGNIYISNSSPRVVADAYMKQFNSDFTEFLRSRSEEVVHGGRMVLTLLGRRSADPSTKECCYLWRLLEIALHDMVSQGMIEEEKIDSFNLPYYQPSPMETISAVQRQGSFVIKQLETFDVKWDVRMGTPTFDKYESSNYISNYIRAAIESMLVSHFGETIMDELFCRYREIIEDCISKEKTEHFCIVVSLKKTR